MEDEVKTALDSRNPAHDPDRRSMMAWIRSAIEAARSLR